MSFGGGEPPAEFRVRPMHQFDYSRAEDPYSKKMGALLDAKRAGAEQTRGPGMGKLTDQRLVGKKYSPLMSGRGAIDPRAEIRAERPPVPLAREAIAQ